MAYSDPPKKRKIRRPIAKASSDVRSDSGYEVQSGKTDKGGVNPRLQGPWANRYKAGVKANRKRYKRAVNPFD